MASAAELKTFSKVYPIASEAIDTARNVLASKARAIEQFYRTRFDPTSLTYLSADAVDQTTTTLLPMTDTSAFDGMGGSTVIVMYDSYAGSSEYGYPLATISSIAANVSITISHLSDAILVADGARVMIEGSTGDYHDVVAAIPDVDEVSTINYFLTQLTAIRSLISYIDAL